MDASTERIWQQLHANIRSFVGRRVRQPADVDDVVQRVFLQVHRGLGSLRDEERVHAWIYRTARNAIADYYRGPVQRREVPSGDLVDLTPSADANVVAADPDEGTALHELAGCLQPLMDELPASDLEALSLTEIKGMTQAEAAGRLGLSVSGMKSRVQRARRRLRGLVEDCCRVELDRRGGIIDYQPRASCACGSCGEGDSGDRGGGEKQTGRHGEAEQN
jgi:RNA polymerase sigma-70 factor (ECF subfamily)